MRSEFVSEPKSQDQRRSERVSVQLTVLVRTELADGKRIQIQAFTQEINAHGGLLESPVRLSRNQKITLVSLQAGKEISCRVVRAEGIGGASFGIAFEFDQPDPHFWPIAVPPGDWVHSEA